MGKREKILVGLMVIALAYAAFELVYFFVDTTPTHDQVQYDPGDARELSVITGRLQQETELEEVQIHVLQAALSQWSRDPFVPMPEYLLDDPEVQEVVVEPEEPEQELPDIHYSGYLEMGRTRMAVINGMEYLVGESLQHLNFVVVSIEPESVSLKCRKSRDEIIVHFNGNGF